MGKAARTSSLRAAFTWLWALVACFYSALAFAYTPPPLTGPVVDEAGVLDATSRARIARKLQTYKGEVGPQIQVFVARSLRDEPISDVAYDTARTWKLGDAERDDGILLLVAPTERKIRIETGKGVGGAVTDLQADRIIQNVIGPRLKAGDYAGGIEGGVDALAKLLGAQSAPADAVPRTAQSSSSVLGPIVLGVMLMIVLLVMFRGRGGGGGGGGGGGSDALSFLAGAFVGSQMRGGWSSGGDSWGGGGGGGSWGGGGGDFGGGGASGDY